MARLERQRKVSFIQNNLTGTREVLVIVKQEEYLPLFCPLSNIFGETGLKEHSDVFRLGKLTFER